MIFILVLVGANLFKKKIINKVQLNIIILAIAKSFYTINRRSNILYSSFYSTNLEIEFSANFVMVFSKNYLILK